MAAPATLPSPTAGKDKGVFALENRSAAISANRAVGECQQYYSDVRRAFGAQD
jgi:hypothetical protein